MSLEAEIRIKKNQIWFYEIEIDQASRGQGLGQKVLDSVIAMSNALQLPIVLAVGEDEDGYDHERLKAWYTKNGFVPDVPGHPDEFQMIRVPDQSA